MSRGHSVKLAAPSRCKNLSVEKLTRAMAEAEDEAIRKRAQAIGQGIRSEDGLKRAVEAVELCLSNWDSQGYF